MLHTETKFLQYELENLQKTNTILQENVHILEEKVKSDWTHLTNTYLLDFTTKNNAVYFKKLLTAQYECFKSTDCLGVTRDKEGYQTRRGTDIRFSATEESWLKPRE